VAHVTRDSDTTFKVKTQKVKGQLAGARAYCGGLPHSLLILLPEFIEKCSRLLPDEAADSTRFNKVHDALRDRASRELSAMVEKVKLAPMEISCLGSDVGLPSSLKPPSEAQNSFWLN